MKILKEILWKNWKYFQKLRWIFKKTAGELYETHLIEVIAAKFNKILSARLFIKKNFENFSNCIKFYKKLLENWEKFSKILVKLWEIFSQCSGKFFVKCWVDFCSENYRDFGIKVKENLVIISRKVLLIMKNFQKSSRNYGRILGKF